ncbi:MAG: hypothetical protein ACR2P8_09295 [Myxococcota bacterium]
MSRVRFAAIALTVLTGFSGLVYQVTWQRSLATLLGSHSEATAAVLGIFLGGLSTGYALFGRVTERELARAADAGRPPRLLWIYGLVEAAIGLWALIFFQIFVGLQALSLSIDFAAPGAAFAFDVLLTIVLIGPPTVLMGGTIPILTQALSSSLEDATRVHAWIYGFNTAGAFFGAFVGGFFLIPLLGLPPTLWAMGAINLGAGVAFLVLSGRTEALGKTPDRVETPRVEGFARYALVALLLGFSMMAFQTTLIRVGGFALGGSQFTFSMVVACFVLCIAIGSLAVSTMRQPTTRHLVACVWGLAGCLLLLYFALPDFTFGAHVLRIAFGVTEVDFWLYHVSAFACLLLVLAIPLGLSGATLPLLFHELRREVGELGAIAGRLYSWNTVGNLLGALLGGYALLFWLDLHQVYRLAVGAVVLAAILLSARRMQRALLVGAGVAVASALLLAVLPAWSPKRLASGLFYARERLPYDYGSPSRFFRGIEDTYPFYADDPTTSVAVRDSRVELGGGRKSVTNRTIVTDGKDDSSLIFEYDTTALSGLIPCLLAERCENVFVVGYGLGGTAGELGALSATRRVVVSEIAQGVIEAAPLFDHANRSATQNPKVEIDRSDAFRALMRSDQRWDVIASMPSNPWSGGVETLYSREFMAAARERLAPGGVYAQWLNQNQQVDAATLSLIIRTHASVFDRAAIWSAGRYNDLLLIGFRDEPPDLATLEQRFAARGFASAFRDRGIGSLAALLVHEILPPGVPNALGLEGPVHTILRPLLNHRAARSFFRGQGTEVPFAGEGEIRRIALENSLYRRHATRHGRSGGARVRELALREACSRRQYVQCLTLVAQWRYEDPDSPRLRRISAELAKLPFFDPAVVERLTGFFDDSPVAESVTLESLQRDVSLYRVFFWSGAPFHPEALQRRLEACEDPRCAVAATASAMRASS